MRAVHADAYWITIYVAGDEAHARRVCREFCDERGWCVTVTPTTYVYTDGEESGVAIGIVNYPRFPTTQEGLWAKAGELADLLRFEMAQTSVLLQAPDRCEWRTDRPA